MKKEAVMLVIQQDGKFLLGKRAGWKKKAAGYWCPVSGHMEVGESEEAAVIREAAEEIGVLVRPTKKITSTLTHDHEVILHWWMTDVLEGSPRLKNDEHEELGWFTPKELQALTPTFAEDIAILLTQVKPC